PLMKRRARRGHCGVDVGRSAVRDACDDLVRRWVDDVEQRARLGEDAADVVPERAVVTRKPGERFLVALRRGAVLHAVKDLGYTSHGASRDACGDGMRRRSWHRMPVRGGVSARYEMLELPLDVREQRARAEPEQVWSEPPVAQLFFHQIQELQ